MDTGRAEELAYLLMSKHGLFMDGWSFGFNTRKTSMGVCRYKPRRIELSRPLVEVNTEATITNTILHEIAHAKAGSIAGHGRLWQLEAIAIGARPERCASEHTQSIAGKWQAVCPGCHETRSMHRKPKRKYSCSACSRGRYNDAFRLDFMEAR
jgi:predicted SprT family Zn-dependent metalloprotease